MRARIAALAAGVALAAQGAPLPVPADLAGWRLFAFDGKPANRYRATPDGAIEVASAGSVSLLYHDVVPELARTPCLAWRWRVERSMPPTDIARKGGDDRPVAVYVTFPYDPDEASLPERMKRVLVELAQGRDAPGRVLVYMWGGRSPRGSMVESPYLGSFGALLVLRSGDAPLGQWFAEEVDVAKDYARVFKKPARQPNQVAIGADSDDTGLESLAQVAELRFQPCREAG